MSDKATRTLQQVVPLCDRFQRLRRAGVKLSNQLVAEMGVVFIEDSEHPRLNTRFTVKSKPFTSLLTPRRVQDFLERYNIVYRRHKGKKQVSAEKQMQIDRSVAKHLGDLNRQFEDGTLHPDQQYNMDESHFVIDLDDGKTLDFVGAQSVKYRSIPADRFPIQRIKEHWRRLAERRNMDAIRKGDWKTGTSSSGKLANPGKKFFLELAAECIRLVNLEKDKNGDNWAKKSMVQCGLDVPRDGVWKIEQLSRELKEIVALYPDAFEEGYNQGAAYASI
ncbi:hypothetical protein BBJ28_00024737 [Nothophytophthora sp. Chile5]|nr:hypothetical protein BBJ28_00024737 [Nothophytophthora sp. Chile5]